MLDYLFLTIFSYYGGCRAAKPGSLVIEHNSMTDNNITSPRDNLQSPVRLNIKHKTDRVSLFFCCSFPASPADRRQEELTLVSILHTPTLSLLQCLHGN